MTRIAALLLIAALALACNKDNTVSSNKTPAAGETITISASIPEALTKISMSPDGDDAGIALAWASGDKIRVVSGSNSQAFDIQSGFTAHKAEFSGTAVTGTSFDIIYPGTFSSVAEAEAVSYTVQTQSGNNSVAHLQYVTVLSGVDSYESIEFTPDWATAHGGTLKRSGVLRVRMHLPSTVNSVKKVKVTIPAVEVNLDAVADISSDHILTVYAMLPMEDQTVASGTDISVRVETADHDIYTRTFSNSTETVYKAGFVNAIKLACDIPGTNVVLDDFAAGSGTATDPWIVANPRQFGRISEIYAAADVSSDFMYYFKIHDDVSVIDASGVDWIALNRGNPYKKGINFDGNGKTISGLTVGSTYAYPSFAGVLYGTVKDVTFDGASISAGDNKAGVVCGYLGTGSIVGNCSGVTVKNSTVTSTSYAGGFIGQVGAAGTVSDCHVINTTVNQNNTTSGGEKSTGGFVGHCAAAATFTGCTVQATIVSKTPGKSGIGGFVGRTATAAATFTNCQVLPGSSVKGVGNWNGGFAGYAQIGGTFKGCSSAADVTVPSGGQFCGGFVGYAGTGTYSDCDACGTVSGPLYVGGFAGDTDGGSFTGCSYTGTSLTATATTGNALLGGFVGYVNVAGVSFSDCYVYNASGVSISATRPRVGGFVGQNAANGKTEQCTTTKCYVKNATITGSTNTGGFVGVQYSSISKCWVDGGTVIAKGANAAGFSAFLQTNIKLEHCYSTAAVQGGGNNVVGGLVGITYSGAAIKFSYATGEVTGTGSDLGGLIGNFAGGVTAEACISWNSTLPYAGTDAGTKMGWYIKASDETGTVSSHAQTLGWSTSIWDLSASLPTLK